ncbi:hypothetical protein [Miniimonas sp. S16]|uniref:hypothetical protein n=1 Tax=Miniimonas sp. S16 TaxID=2171623 RepID=UPI00131ED652|nr:hypothetical protein [Miniimonas sp. S16]
MRARLIDPRDARSEDVAPTYRVLFWANATTCEEWELTSIFHRAGSVDLSASVPAPGGDSALWV